MSVDLDVEAVDHFKEYLRIPSVQPDCDYSGCVEFLTRLAKGLGLSVAVHQVAAQRPVVLLSWPGSRPDQPCLLLSSHMDVVPVYPDFWTYHPFGAEEDEAGNIYARGAQDMKCVGIQYLEAIRRLIRQGYQPKRSVHVCFTPDEEIGCLGMKLFVQTEAFQKLNIGCALDEGIASPDESFHLFYGERTIYNVGITCAGTAGHGSLLHEDTPGEKLGYVIKKFMEKRTEEKKKLMTNPDLTIGDVTSINLTMVQGGVLANVVPSQFMVIFDCRLSLDTDNSEFEIWVEQVCTQAGQGVSVEYVDKTAKVKATKLSPENPWWVAMKKRFDELELRVNTRISPAASDSWYIRELGIPAFGFSPMNHTTLKIHEHDEFLNKDVFLNGIDIYCELITALANV